MINFHRTNDKWLMTDYGLNYLNDCEYDENQSNYDHKTMLSSRKMMLFRISQPTWKRWLTMTWKCEWPRLVMMVMVVMTRWSWWDMLSLWLWSCILQHMCNICAMKVMQFPPLHTFASTTLWSSHVPTPRGTEPKGSFKELAPEDDITFREGAARNIGDDDGTLSTCCPRWPGLTTLLTPSGSSSRVMAVPLDLPGSFSWHTWWKLWDCQGSNMTTGCWRWGCSGLRRSGPGGVLVHPPGWVLRAEGPEQLRSGKMWSVSKQESLPLISGTVMAPGVGAAPSGTLWHPPTSGWGFWCELKISVPAINSRQLLRLGDVNEEVEVKDMAGVKLRLDEDPVINPVRHTNEQSIVWVIPHPESTQRWHDLYTLT